MFSYQFLAVIISLRSVVFADILVKSNYGQQHDAYYMHPFIPQYEIQTPDRLQLPIQNYFLPNQKSTLYFVRPNEPLLGNIHSRMTRHPNQFSYHNYHHPKPSNTDYIKIENQEYRQPIFVGYPQPLTVHNRYKRSRKSIPTKSNEFSESSKPEIVAHDNDVAAKSSLIDKHSTIDSLFLENKTTDLNDKHVENREIKGNNLMKPFLFGFYPNKPLPQMYSENSRTMQDNYQTQVYSDITNAFLYFFMPFIPFDVSKLSDNYYKYTLVSPNTNMNKAQWFRSKSYSIYTPHLINPQVMHMKWIQPQQFKQKYFQVNPNTNIISTAQPRQKQDTVTPIYSEKPKSETENPNAETEYHCTEDLCTVQHHKNTELKLIDTSFLEKVPNYFSYDSDKYPYNNSN